jgi:TatD DNase family protein
MHAWIDTHIHLDAPEFASDALAVRERARAAGVVQCVFPAVAVAHTPAVRALAHAPRANGTAGADGYALGIHPLFVPQAADDDVAALDALLTAHRADPRLLAVGEIGLDYFVPALTQPPLRQRQEQFYRDQLQLARAHGLPVLLHVRRSADQLLQGLRAVGRGGHVWRGIAHAFNGSAQQAKAFIDLGFKLGFGGAFSYERAQNLRRLAAELPLDAIVLETDAPDMPPHWLYTTAAQRAAGQPQGRNEPAELPRIAAELAALRGMSLAALAEATTANAHAALPKLRALLV